MSVTSSIAPPSAPSAQQTRRRNINWQELSIAILLAVMVIVATIAVPEFGSAENIRSVLIDSAFLGIVAVGVTLIVISGNFIDLSVVAQIAVAGIVFVLLEPNLGLWGAALVAALTLQLFAALNAFGVGLLKANAVVVTLAVQTAGFGLLQFLTGGAQNPNGSDALREHAAATIGPVPVPFMWLLVLVAVGQFILTRTNLGLSIKAVGTLRGAARNSGVRPARTIWMVFAFSSLMCAIAGILLTGFNNNAISGMGTGFDFGALAAVIIGGASLFGGRGSVTYTLLGVLLVSVLLNILMLSGLPYNYQELVKGLIIVAAVGLDVSLRRKGSK